MGFLPVERIRCFSVQCFVGIHGRQAFGNELSPDDMQRYQVKNKQLAWNVNCQQIRPFQGFRDDVLGLLVSTRGASTSIIGVCLRMEDCSMCSVSSL